MNAIHLSDTLLRASLQGAIAIAAVWLITRIFKTIPAAVQVWLWRLVCLKLLLSLLFVIPVIVQSGPAPQGPEPDATIPTLIAGIWLAGVATVILGLIRDGFHVRRLVKSATPLVAGPALEKVKDLRRWMNGREVPILLSHRIDRPMLVGALRPRILLPIGLETGVSQSHLKMILAHEFEHIRRRDLAWGWLAAFTEAFFFFHPLNWLLARELSAAQEAACDWAAVRRCDVTAAAYGRMLLSMTISDPRAGLSPALAAKVGGTYRSLRDRIDRLVAPRTRMSPVKCSLLALLAATILPTWQAAAEPIVAGPAPAGGTSEPLAGLAERFEPRVAGLENQPLIGGR